MKKIAQTNEGFTFIGTSTLLLNRVHCRNANWLWDLQRSRYFVQRFEDNFCWQILLELYGTGSKMHKRKGGNVRRRGYEKSPLGKLKKPDNKKSLKHKNILYFSQHHGLPTNNFGKNIKDPPSLNVEPMCIHGQA